MEAEEYSSQSSLPACLPDTANADLYKLDLKRKLIHKYRMSTLHKNMEEILWNESEHECSISLFKVV